MMTIRELNKICQNTLISHLEIEFIDFGDDYIKARMPVNNKKSQPMGLLHGGASLALAESVAGAGSLLFLDTEKYTAYGFQVSGNHVSTVRSGEVIAVGRLIHKGNTMHIWDVEIKNEDGKLVSISRVSNIIRKKE